MSLPEQPLARATAFASRHHASEIRKDGRRPYLSHPLAVASLVLAHGGDETQAAAALLHDTIANGRVTPGELEREFGAEVARLVDVFSDPPAAAGSASPAPGSNSSAAAGQVAEWRRAREAYLGKLEAFGARELLTVLCEELHELGELLQDLRYEGPAVWKRFATQPLEVFWYFREVLALGYRKLDREKHRVLLGEMARMLSELKPLAGAS